MIRLTRFRDSASTAGGDREVRLPGPGRPDPGDDVVVRNESEIFRLTRRLRLDDRSPDTRQRTIRVSPPPPGSRDRPCSCAGRHPPPAPSPCFAASIIRCATDAARSTASAVPTSVSVSPRRATRVPVWRCSSIRLASLTRRQRQRDQRLRCSTAASFARRSTSRLRQSPTTAMCRSPRSSRGTAVGAPSNSARAAVVSGRRSRRGATSPRRAPSPRGRIRTRCRRGGGAPAPQPFEQEPESRECRRVVDA